MNFCYSYELHERTKQNATDPMKWYAPYGSSSENRLLGREIFPHRAFAIEAIFLIRKSDSIVVLVLVLRNFLQKEDNVSWFDTSPRRGKDSMVFLKDEMTQEVYLLFPDDFFEPVPTKDDLVWGNYLDCLREEWFVLFDRLAHLQFVTLPH